MLAGGLGWLTQAPLQAVPLIVRVTLDKQLFLS